MKVSTNDHVSIRRVLLRWLLLPLVALLSIAGIQGYSVALYPATQAYDGALLDAALSILRVLVQTGKPSELTFSATSDILLRTDQVDKIYYSVRESHSGTLLDGDQELGLPPFTPPVAEPLFYDSTINSAQIRVVSLRAKHQDTDVVIQVAETTLKRQRLFQWILLAVVTSEMLLIIAAVALTWFALGKGLEPLQRLRSEIEARSHKDLSPVPESHAPLEVRSLVQALNKLLQQMESALQAQQIFIADAAHQLRTPLAGLRMQVELGLQQKDPAQWWHTLKTLRPVTQRTARLANQLLTLAKAEVDANKLDALTVVDLSAVAEQVAEEWMPKAIAKELDFGLKLSSTKVQGNALLLGELLANLIDNAITYTPNGGRITLRCIARDREGVLEIQDDGIGIPVTEREDVFNRFHRVDGSPGEGSGLGLAIVKEILRLHGGSIELHSPGGHGSLFIVKLPLAVSTS